LVSSASPAPVRAFRDVEGQHAAFHELICPPYSAWRTRGRIQHHHMGIVLYLKTASSWPLFQSSRLLTSSPCQILDDVGPSPQVLLSVTRP
jgi:hypothetical protein